MLIIISPSKTQDFAPLPRSLSYTQPHFLDESSKLVTELRKKKPAALRELMDISDNLAELNHSRYQEWQVPFTIENAKQALFAFKGDVYTGIPAEEYSDEELQYAQEHLRILSGLYGLLRPLDLMQPYRLEMKIKLKNKRGADLYKFWGSRLTEGLNDALQQQKEAVLVNLASNEYYKAVQPKNIKGRIITPQFKEFKNGKYSTVALFAKRARGLMTDYILRNRLEAPEDIKGFNQEGYSYSEPQSTGDEWVFVR
ncbi:peroxide stress protein YaaA [Cesiribacter sp. SM1]|uniref:peroxide stress protein YaaA n=1 Tax=Cesiribacter sp. SM1 TaxID=2861196 RepID=UPI001CD4D31D|nr:peroxide stress protein YaaA [Cesiribacter sp. SM1]